MALANISVNDATTPTPVAHVFIGIADGNQARYVNDAGAQTLKGQETLQFTVNRVLSSAKSQQNKPNYVAVKMWDPKEVNNGDGTFTVAYGSSSVTEFNFAQAATAQDRADLVTMHINALNALKADIVALIPRL